MCWFADCVTLLSARCKRKTNTGIYTYISMKQDTNIVQFLLS